MKQIRVCKKYEVKYSEKASFNTDEFTSKIEPILRETEEYELAYKKHAPVRKIFIDDWLFIIKRLEEKADAETSENDRWLYKAYAMIMRSLFNDADKRDGWIHCDFQ